MTYPVVSSPYGLKPINLQGGRVFSGSTRMIPIQQGYATNIFNGDVVGLSAGTAIITPYSAASGTAAPGQIIGVFLGAEYSVPNSVISGKNRFQMYNASQNTSTDIVGYVVDDPLAYYKAAVIAQPQGLANTQANTGLNVGYMSPRFVGTNAFLVAGNGGNTQNGDSYAGVCGGNPTVASSVAGNIPQTVGSGAATTSPCLRVIQLVQETSVTYSTTITSATGSGTSFVVASSTGLQPGMQVVLTTATGTSAGAPGNTTYVTGVVTSTNTVTVSASVAWTLNQTVAFVGYPEVILGWNFGYHTYNIAAGV